VDVPPAIELAWMRGQGAESCIDGVELSQRVQATIGRPVRAVSTSHDGEEGAPEAVEVLDGSVVPLPSGGWIAVVDVRGAQAASLRREVTLDAPDCRALDEAIVLVVALMADAPLPRPPALVVPLRRASVALAMGPDVAFASGMLPGVAPGVGLSIDVGFPRYWHLAAWAHAWPFDQALEGTSGARLAAWTFGVGPCVGPTIHDRVTVFGCIGVSTGVVYASGVGLDLSQSGSTAYFQGEVRAGGRARLWGPLSLRLEGGLGVPTTRATYFFTNNGADAHEVTVFRTAAVVPLIRLGLEFWSP
jgi:hypothetical protein